MLFVCECIRASVYVCCVCVSVYACVCVYALLCVCTGGGSVWMGVCVSVSSARKCV